MPLKERDRFFIFLAYILRCIFFYSESKWKSPHLFTTNRITGNVDFWYEASYDFDGNETFMYMYMMIEANVLLSMFFDKQSKINVVEMSKNGLFFNVEPMISDNEIEKTLSSICGFEKNVASTTKNVSEDVFRIMKQWNVFVDKNYG